MTVDRTAALIAAARRRRDDTRRKATETLRRLDTTSTPTHPLLARFEHFVRGGEQFGDRCAGDLGVKRLESS